MSRVCLAISFGPFPLAEGFLALFGPAPGGPVHAGGACDSRQRSPEVVVFMHEPVLTRDHEIQPCSRSPDLETVDGGHLSSSARRASCSARQVRTIRSPPFWRTMVSAVCIMRRACRGPMSPVHSSSHAPVSSVSRTETLGPSFPTSIFMFLMFDTSCLTPHGARFPRALCPHALGGGGAWRRVLALVSGRGSGRRVPSGWGCLWPGLLRLRAGFSRSLAGAGLGWRSRHGSNRRSRRSVSAWTERSWRRGRRGRVSRLPARWGRGKICAVSWRRIPGSP